MQGTILAFDFRSGEGVISGEDGLRYRITMQEWKHALPPAVGQTVDFQPAGDIAGAIYVIQQPSPFSGDKNRLVAALLALFLGMLGVHKFYLGKNTAGLIMLAGGTIGWVLVLP
ncbi:MAG TPA: NINE protein, partial [Novosphingobium sp.]|nr:NINE protein [Novosphingobium sp.]